MTNRDRPEKLHATAFDALAAALSPALIIGMIGSLVFFLVIAFYRGQYDARLMYILALYTAATVLVARIAIESDRARAAAFAVPLAIAAMLGMMRFVTIQGELAALAWGVNIGLLGLVYYLADRITFDCTLLEEDRESLQGGLLQTIGSSVAKAAGQEIKPSSSDTGSASKQPIGAAPLKKARHNPGVWVLYFAIIAFPLFGVGQLVIPDERQRSIAFWCLVSYLACALALLMTTSLLGMRRYLRQRGAMMPPDITAKWLMAGGLITVGILLACMLMPLPGNKLSVAGLKIELTSPDNLQTSKFGWGNKGPSKSPDGSASDQVGQQQGGQQQGGQQQGGQQQGGQQQGGQQQSGQQQSGQQQSGQQQGGQQQGGQQQSGQQQSGQQQGGQQQGGQQQSKEQSNGQQPQGGQPANNQQKGQRQGNTGNENPPNKSANEAAQAGQRAVTNSGAVNQPLRAGDSLSNASRSLASSLLDSLKSFGSLFKWLLIAVLSGIVLLYTATHWDDVRQLVANLVNFVNALMGRRGSAKPEGQATQPVVEAQPARRPFKAFQNPFERGLQGWQGPQVVLHTFNALEAWAAQRGRLRAADQTAEEFAKTLVAQEPELDRLPLQAASMLDRVMFAGWQPSRQEVGALEQLWQRMTA